jgi:hypothetical protein
MHPTFPLHYGSLVVEMKLNRIEGTLPEILRILTKTHDNTRCTLDKEEHNFVQLPSLVGVCTGWGGVDFRPFCPRPILLRVENSQPVNRVLQSKTVRDRYVRGGLCGLCGADSNQSQTNHKISRFLNFLKNQTNHREIIAIEKHQPMDKDTIPKSQLKDLKQALKNQPCLLPFVSNSRGLE